MTINILKKFGVVLFIFSLSLPGTTASAEPAVLQGEITGIETAVLQQDYVQAEKLANALLDRKPPHKYFLLRAKGDSMDQGGIHDGDLLLIRQQTTAQDGDIVAALIDDEAVVKEFHAAGETVVLKPRSSNKRHQPIVLTKDFQIQGVVVTAIPRI